MPLFSSTIHCERACLNKMYMRSKIEKTGAINTLENACAQTKTAKWLLNVLGQNAQLCSCFFRCLEWVIGDLRAPLQSVLQEVEKSPETPDIMPARKAIDEMLPRSKRKLVREFAELFVDIDIKAHRGTAFLLRRSRRFTVRSTAVLMARLSITHRNASAPLSVRQRW